MGKSTQEESTLPPYKTKKVPPGTFQSPTELFEKTKKASKNYRQIFRQHKNDPKTSSSNCGKSLQDPSITIFEINKSLKWLTKAELC